MQKLEKYAVWIAIALTALVLLAAGGAKLAGVPQVHQSFAILGLPRWFGYFIGSCEVAGAIGLCYRPISALAAAGVFTIMLGALYFHLAHTPMAQGVPALVLLVLSGFIFVKRRAQLLEFK